jgi:hypothetical protein
VIRVHRVMERCPDSRSTNGTLWGLSSGFRGHNPPEGAAKRRRGAAVGAGGESGERAPVGGLAGQVEARLTGLHDAIKPAGSQLVDVKGFGLRISHYSSLYSDTAYCSCIFSYLKHFKLHCK